MMQPAHLQEICCDLIADVVRTAGAANLRVTGASMLPAIQPGDVLKVRRNVLSELQPNQIVLYRRNGRFIAHRIHSISGEYLFTRGDSLPSPDPPVWRGDAVGRVETIMRNQRELDVRWTTWQRATAWILRRSKTCTMIYVRVYIRIRQRAACPEKVRGHS
jgi:signal peptidase I